MFGAEVVSGCSSGLLSPSSPVRGVSMADEQDPQTDNNTTEPELSELDQWKQKAQAMEQRASEMYNSSLRNSVQLAGFDPDTGPGKLLAESFSGEPTLDEFKKHAANYGITPPSNEVQNQTPQGGDATQQTQGDSVGSGGPPGQPHNAAADIGAQANSDALRANSQQPKEASISEKISQAEQQGDFMTAVGLKTQLTKDMKQQQ